MNDRSQFVVNPPGETVEAAAGPSSERKKISELTENDANIELLGHIVQMLDPRYYEICPQCGKRARAENGVFRCLNHGEVKPDYGYVLNFDLDDGSDNIRVVAFRQQVDALFQKTESDMLDFKENPENFTQLKDSILGNLVKISGRVTSNQMFNRNEFIASRIDPNPKPEEEIQRLSP